MFFNEQGQLRLDELVMADANFQKVMADEHVSDEEIEQQAQHVLKLFQQMENSFSEEQLAQIADLLVQTGVLQSIMQQQELQEFHH